MKKPVRKNAFYAQSGGVTAVINASACGVIETARASTQAHRQGLRRPQRHHRRADRGADRHQQGEPRRRSAALKHTPGGAFGSSRYKLKGLDKNRAEYERLIEVFSAHDIGYFFYNGGNDSADTASRSRRSAKPWAIRSPASACRRPWTTTCRITDCCPGFGSVAKYVAVSMLEAGLDVASMARTSTKVFILEVMGRHAGWIAAAGGLAGSKAGEPPHMLLFPEIAFDKEKFLAKVEAVRHGLRLLRDRRLRRRGRRGRQVPRRSRHQGRLRPRAAGRRGPVIANMVREAQATSTTGPSPTTCSAPRATSPRRPTSSSPMPSARRRWSSR